MKSFGKSVCITRLGRGLLLVCCRRQLLPELTEFERPPTVAMKSTDNIPIESCWSYWQDYAGRNIKAVILDGHSKGYFASADPDHVYVGKSSFSTTQTVE